MSSVLTVEKRGNVCLIGLNDAEHLNAFSLTMIEEMHQVITQQVADGNNRFVFHGHGPSFSSGAHMDDYLQTLRDVQQNKAHRFYESERKLLDIARILRRPTTFSVTAAHGWVIGIGVELALACDFIVAADDATFWMPETASGWNAGMGVANRLTRTVGSGWARRMLLLNEKVPAAKAADIGMVARLVPADKVVDEALAVMKTLDRHSPLATQYQKRLLEILPNVSIDDSMELEIITGYWLAHTHDVREAAQAFIEKRRPDFTGN